MSLCAVVLAMVTFSTEIWLCSGYSVDDCVVTVTSADTGGGSTYVIYINSNAQLAELEASVAGCAATGGAGGGGGWRVVGGALYIRDADDVVDLEALKDLRAIDGKSNAGYSLSIFNNANLASLAGLRNVRGALPGALRVSYNDALTSLSGLEGITRIEGKSGGLGSGWSLLIGNNGVLCLSAADRARLTSCAGPGSCSTSACTNQGGCDGTALAIAGGGNVDVQARPSTHDGT